MKKLIKATLFSIFIFLSTTDLIAQAPVKQFDKTFGGTDGEASGVLQYTFDGGFIVGGLSRSGIGEDRTQDSRGMQDYWVVKADKDGNKQWDKRFGGNKTDDMTAILHTTDSGYLLGGWSISDSGFDRSSKTFLDDYWIVKIDRDGNKQWDKSYGSFGSDNLRAMKRTSDGGYILGGESTGDKGNDKTEDSKGLWDYWVVKVDAQGNKEWDRTFGGDANDNLRDIIQTKDSGYLIGGFSLSGKTGDRSEDSWGNADYWVVKTDKNGNKQWDKRYGGVETDILGAFIQTVDGGFLIGGSSESSISGDKSQNPIGLWDYWIVKTDNNGNKEWDKRFGGLKNEALSTVLQTEDKGFVLGGFGYSGIGGDKSEINRGNQDVWLVKTDSAGNKQWNKTLGSDGHESLASLFSTDDNGFILGCASSSFKGYDKSEDRKGSGDFWVVKLNTNYIVNNKVSICEGDSILLQGSYQKTSGTYYDSLKTSMNIDSIIVSTLTVSQTFFTKTTARVCGYDSILIGGNYIKTSGVYYDSLKSSLGCDSIVEVTVADSSIKVGKLAKFGPYGLQSTVSGDKYVWLDCDNNYAVISGLTLQTALNLKNGRYAVEVTRNGCIDTSECSSINVGISEVQFANSISIYPNPTTNRFILDLGKEYSKISLELITLTGQVVKSITYTNEKEISLGTQQQAKGVYFLRVTADGKQTTKRIIIQ